MKRSRETKRNGRSAFGEDSRDWRIVDVGEATNGYAGKFKGATCLHGGGRKARQRRDDRWIRASKSSGDEKAAA